MAKGMTLDEFQTIPDAASGGLFLKLKDKGSAEFIVLCDPEDESPIFERQIVQTAAGLQDFDPNDPSHKGLKINTRYRIKIYNCSLGRLQIMEFGIRLMQTILHMVAKQGWARWVYDITRQGTTMRDTKYVICNIREVGAAEKVAIADALEQFNFPLDPAKRREDTDDDPTMPF